MKTCPNCGSILADNEPYCENCGFDPDFDMGSWNIRPQINSRKPYYHGDHIKSSQNKQNDFLSIITGFIFLGTLIFIALLILNSYNWNIGYLILSNLDSVAGLILAVIIRGPIIYFINMF